MDLESAFAVALQDGIEAGRERGYIPTYFLRMLDEYGGVQTAKRLLSKHDTQTGLFKLWELGLLDVSMEAIVLQDRFRTLFSEAEIAEARRRLEELGYFRH